MRTVVQLKKPYGKSTFSRVKNARSLGWVDAFDLEFEDGLCFLEPQAFARKASRISARASIFHRLGSMVIWSVNGGEKL